MQWFNAIIMFLCLAENIDSLPVTSKPLDNTPEHLAWEAWIMVPQAHNKTRKITPKSIFILPNKATSPQVSCPPGYLIENSKCIQTVQIDSNAILLNHLANVLNNTNYDFDYDYDEFEEPHSQMGEADKGTNDGPLKIDLLSPSSAEYSTRNEDDYFNKSDENRGSLTSPLYKESTVSATVSTWSTSIKTLTSERDVAGTTVSTTTSVDQETSTHDNLMPDLPFESLPDSTPTSSTTPLFNVPPKSNQSSLIEERITTTPPFAAVPTAFALKDAAELSSVDVEDVGKTSAIKNDREIGFTQEDIATEVNDFTAELQPSSDTPSTPKGEMITHEVDKLNGTNEPKSGVEQTVLPIYSITTEASVTSLDQTSSTTLTTSAEPSTVEHKSENVTSIHKTLAPDMAEETEEIIDEQKNNEYGSNIQNRFVYQHFNKNFSKEQGSSVINTEEPLYTIKKIVEESKKQSEQTPVRSVGNLVQQSEVEKATHHFSVPSVVNGITPTRPAGLFSSVPTLPAMRDSTFLTPTLPWNIMRYPPAAVTPVRQNANPFSWLPSSWEVESSAERPLLLRFWSRAIPTANSANQTPTMHRENSRSPTENLYREISSQEFYKVLGARNSRLQSPSRFP